MQTTQLLPNLPNFCVLHLAKVKGDASDTFISFQDVVTSGFKMRGGIIRLGDENLFVGDETKQSKSIYR